MQTSRQPTLNKTILVVEDNQHHREAITKVLENAGYGVIPTKTGEGAMHVVNAESIDGAVVDLELEGAELQGMNFIDKCDKKDVSFPFLIVTVTPYDDAEKIFEFSLGRPPLLVAHDFVQKRPNDAWLDEMCQRLHNLLFPWRDLNFGPYRWDKTEERVYRGNAPIEPEPSDPAKCILRHLLQHAGTTVDKLQLYALLHPRDDHVADPGRDLPLSEQVDEEQKAEARHKNLVERYVAELRNKLDNDVIETRGTGYCLHVPINHPLPRRQPHRSTNRIVVEQYQLEIRPYPILIIKGHNSRTIGLELDEVKPLEILMRTAGAIHSRAWIHERVYGASDVTTPLSEVDRIMTSLQAKINGGELNPISHDGAGSYCFTP